MKLVKKYTFIVAASLALGLAASAQAQTAATPAASTPAKPAAAKPAAKKSPAAAAKPKAPPPAASIVWRGDRATERAFVGDLVKQYELSKLGKVTMQPFSTVSGIDAVHDGSADVAGSARSAMPGRNEESDLTFVPIAWEALVPITSPKNPISNISIEQLHEIYLGYINNWKDVGGPDLPMNLYAVAGPLDGVEYSLRQLLFHKGDQQVAVPRLYLNTAKLEEGVTLDPQSLGFTTLSAVYANKAIKVMSVEGVAPSTATVSDGSYPLYSLLYLASRSSTDGNSGKNREAIEKFIQYATSDAGKTIIRKHFLVPYDEAPTLAGKQDERVAFIDARIATAPSMSNQRPVSAPVATADYLIRTQPNSVEAQQAKLKAAQAQAQMKGTATEQKPSGN